jgi:outer membrane protein assembly factor BamB
MLLSGLIHASCSAQTSSGPGEYREFKDQRGRQIQALVLDVNGDEVTIQRRDGRKFTVAVTAFSQADQDYIRGLASGGAATAPSDDWPRFRGPNGSGTSDAKGLPLEWSANKNIVWKTALPGPGASSPITWGDRIYLTCYTGYGIDEESPGDPSNLVRHLICLDRGTGRILWNTGTPSRRRVSEYGRFIALHGFASSTPVCDGERVYCFYGSSGVYAFDLRGGEQWDADAGQETHGFGTGTSPILHDTLVIVNASVESGSLVALDKQTGREVWRAGDIQKSWNTPVLVEAGGRLELVVDTEDSLRAFDPATGRALWRCEGSQPPRYLCPSPIVHDGIIYATHGYHGPLSAVRPGGNGDVTNSHRLWVRPKVATNVPSPVFHDGYIYSVREEGGVFSCVNAENGELVFRERLQPAPGRIYASPLAADGKIYLVSREDGTYVLSAQPQFEQLAHNVIEGDDSIFNGSFVVSRGQLLLRSDKALYCIGVK